MKWYEAYKKKNRAEYRTQVTRVYLYPVATGKHNDPTQAQIEAEKALKAWMEANG